MTEPQHRDALEDYSEIESSPAFRNALIADYLGRMIRRARVSLGLSQNNLAKALDTSQPGIARLERGANIPTIDTLLRVADSVGQKLVIGILPESTIKEILNDQVMSGQVLAAPFMVDPFELAAAEPSERGVDYFRDPLRS